MARSTAWTFDLITVEGPRRHRFAFDATRYEVELFAGRFGDLRHRARRSGATTPWPASQFLPALGRANLDHMRGFMI